MNRRRTARTVLGVTILLSAIGWGAAGRTQARPGSAEGKQGAEPLARAQEAADALTAALMSELLREMSSEGPIGAIRVCSEVAQQTARDLSGDGLRVRRVSLKVRNPANTPDDFEKRVLEWLEAGIAAGKEAPSELSATFKRDGRRELRYLRTIRVADTCLACHGDPASIDPGVRKILAERYPSDCATGYKAGDLRGAISATVSLD